MKTTLKDAVEKLNSNPKDEAAQKTLDNRCGGLSVIHLVDGKIDYEKTVLAIEYCKDTDESKAPDCISFNDWKGINQEKRMACPATGKALLGGRLRVDRTHLPAKSLNWGSVSEERRLLVAYRVETRGPIDPIVAYAAVCVQELATEWKLLADEWSELLGLNEKSASQRALIERVRSRIWYDKVNQDRREKTLDFFNRSLAPFATPKPPLEPIRVVMLYAVEDSHFVEEFVTHASMTRKSGMAEFWGIHGVEVERDASPVSINLVREKIGDADVCMHFLSADYLKTDLMESVKGLHVVHVPINLRPHQLGAYSYLASKQALPRHRAVTSYRDRDDAWLEVVRDLQEKLKGLRRS